MRTAPSLLALALTIVVATARPGAGPAGQGGAAQPPPEGQQAGQTPPTQQEPDRAQQPIRTGINFVRVDVIVTDRDGNPVLDLKKEDFSVTEDGKPQQIETFSVVTIAPADQIDAPVPTEIRSKFDEEREAARPDVRLFVILLDDYHVRRGNDMVVRKPLIDFIQNQLAPQDLVALMYPLTSVNDLTFTRDRGSLIRQIEQFQGRRFDYQPRNQFEERYAYYPAATVERVRNQVVMDALIGASVKLGSLREGRKSIIYVSEGFTNSLPPQLNDPVAAIPGINNPARGRSDIANSDRQEFMNSMDLYSDLREVFVEASRNNTSIYALDPKGLAPFEYDIQHGINIQVDRKHLEAGLDTLRALASETDGRAIINRNDLAVGMKQIIRDSSGYYLLGYNSSGAPTDGKFHEIKVRVNRRGMDVRARKGYWAYTAEAAARATTPGKSEAPGEVSSALATLAEPTRGRPAKFWVGTMRGENGRTRVTFTWETIPPLPGERRPPGDAAARVMLMATAADGRPLFRGRVPGEGQTPTPAASGPTAAAAAGGGQISFEAPPGQVQLRMVVEGSGGQVLDSATRELTLPDFTTVQVSFGTPQVFRGRTPRYIQQVRASADAVPTAERNFARTDRLLIRAPAYAPGTTVPTVTARLLSRGGDAMSDLPVQSAGGGSAEIELSLSSLATGEYLVHLTAKTESGTAEEYIAFRVR